MGVGSGGRGPWPPWIFKRDTNIVDRGLKVLFFGLFCFISVFFFIAPSLKWLNSAIFRYFLLIFSLFSVVPPSGKFSAEALALNVSLMTLHLLIVRLTYCIRRSLCGMFIDNYRTVNSKRNKKFSVLIACKPNQNKIGFFRGPAFIQPIRAV